MRNFGSDVYSKRGRLLEDRKHGFTEIVTWNNMTSSPSDAVKIFFLF